MALTCYECGRGQGDTYCPSCGQSLELGLLFRRGTRLLWVPLVAAAAVWPIEGNLARALMAAVASIVVGSTVLLLEPVLKRGEGGYVLLGELGVRVLLGLELISSARMAPTLVRPLPGTLGDWLQVLFVVVAVASPWPVAVVAARRFGTGLFALRKNVHPEAASPISLQPVVRLITPAGTVVAAALLEVEAGRIRLVGAPAGLGVELELEGTRVKGRVWVPSASYEVEGEIERPGRTFLETGDTVRTAVVFTVPCRKLPLAGRLVLERQLHIAAAGAPSAGRLSTLSTVAGEEEVLQEVLARIQLTVPDASRDGTRFTLAGHTLDLASMVGRPPEHAQATAFARRLGDTVLRSLRPPGPVSADRLVVRLVTAPPPDAAHVRLGPELVALYAEDRGDHYRPLAEAELDALALPDPLATATANLYAAHAEIGVVVGAVAMLRCGGNDEAALVLVPEVRRGLGEHLGEPLWFHVPARDLMLCAGPAGHAALVELAARPPTAELHHPLHPGVFVWGPDGPRRIDGTA